MYVTKAPFLAMKHTLECSAINIIAEVEAAGMVVRRDNGIRSVPAGGTSLIVHNKNDFLVMLGDYIVYQDGQLYAMYGPTFEALFMKDHSPGRPVYENENEVG